MSDYVPFRRDANFLWLFATLLLIMFMASLSQLMLASAVPTIVGELNGVDSMAWILTGFMLAATIVMPIYGKVSDIYGRKPLIVIAIILFTCGSALGGLAMNMPMVIAARVVQGLGGGGLIMLSQTAIADVVPARERAKYGGYLGTGFAVSSVAGPLLGGWMTEGPGWRWAFWINVPLGIVALIAVFLFLRLPARPRAQERKIDVMGMIMMAAATTSIILLATWGGTTFSWESPVMLGLMVAAVIFGGLFAFIEARATQPVIPLKLFRERNFVLSTLAAMLIGIAMFGVMGYMSVYFQMAMGESATMGGLMMIPLMGSMLLVSVIAGDIVARTGRYKWLIILGGLTLTGGLFLLSTVSMQTSILEVSVYMAVVGTGLGMTQQILTIVVQNTFSQRIVGTATGAHTFFRQIGSSLGSSVVGALFGARLTLFLMENLPAGSGSTGGGKLTPDAVNALPESAKAAVELSYNQALIPIYGYLVPLILLATLALCFITEKALSQRVENNIAAESLAEGQLLQD